ncbi:hypothetical protein [Glaciihabitans sp. dw_435]|uniref:hypothetical protein n=1 Tax=Glaciihabitans sp. dw_435 TaxID=2720081 RepID=UPI001BD358EE|nr:hypothetical protein [Glaciihabitans sp. dw_435]
MTVRGVLRLLLRRWYVVLVCAAVTAFSIGSVSKIQGVYTTQVQVVFLSPLSVNTLEDFTDGIVQFAALVERKFNGNRGSAPITLQSSSLYGEGVREGYRVTLVDSGGQWGTNFNRQMLSVEVVGSSPEQVSATVTDVTDRISRIAADEQSAQHVATADRIETITSPEAPVIGYVGGNLPRAALAILALGGASAVVASAGVDSAAVQVGRWRSRRRKGAGAAAPTPHPAH